jgi:hypothetical protein
VKRHLLGVGIIPLLACCLLVACASKKQETKQEGKMEQKAEILKVYKQEVPALRFIGKKYNDNDRVNGMFGKVWMDWFQNGWFDLLRKQTDIDLKSMFEDGDAEIGLLRYKANGEFEYWIGLYMPENTLVPDGFVYYDFSKAALGVCRLYGDEAQVFFQDERCREKLEELGYEVIKDQEGTIWSLERGGAPDEKGKLLMDICFYVK